MTKTKKDKECRIRTAETKKQAIKQHGENLHDNSYHRIDDKVFFISNITDNPDDTVTAIFPMTDDKLESSLTYRLIIERLVKYKCGECSHRCECEIGREFIRQAHWSLVMRLEEKIKSSQEISEKAKKKVQWYKRIIKEDEDKLEVAKSSEGCDDIPYLAYLD